MKLASLRWQPVLLSALIVSTLGVLVWSVLYHFAAQDVFMPHKHCYLLKRDLILLHGISDFLIGFSYVAISATLTYLVLRARQEIPFHWMMLAFATFIVACGGTHFMEVWTLEAPDPPYWLAGDLKLVTAFASLTTAFLLPPLVPKILRLLSEARLSAERKEALEQTHQELELALSRVQQLDQLKTNFFANISHELRTPVTLIVGPADRLLLDPETTEEQRTDLQLIRRNALLLHKHVTDLLEVSRLEAGKTLMRYRHTDLAQAARLVVSYFSSSSVRPLDLSLNAPDSLPAEVDAEKFERVLLNLVSNAYKFSPTDGVIALTLAAEGAEIVLKVEDTGPGVPAELREAIFERFNQGINPTSRGGAGTGLGLSIVKEFVELHGGTVRVEDRPGGGASFQVRLPRFAPEGTEVAPSESSAAANLYRSATAPLPRLRRTKAEILEPAEEGGEAAGKPLIIVAEDNADMRDHIQRTLGQEFRLLIATDGANALLLAEDHTPDLILTDLMMPEMNGQELLEQIRQHPRLSSAPVILLTARADDELRLDLLRSGAQDYILKPFGAEELRVRVRNVITTKQVRDTLQSELASQEHDLARLAQEVTTRARELERAKQVAESANRAKDQFLAVLSHELRTPLTPALATAMNLEHQVEIDPDELRRSLRVIRRNIELESRLIDDLLDLTRIARGKLQLFFAEVDVHEAIRHAVEMCQSEFMNKGSQVKLDLEAERHFVRADPPRMQQIVWNLLLNAVKFTPPDGRIALATRNTPEGRLILEISDTGVGIAPEVMPRIFDPFEQGERTTTRRFGGLGLGLAVVKGLVDAHGGSIDARSDGAGRGATFHVEMETIDSPLAATPDAPAGSHPEATASSPLKILLVEDHEDTRHAMERLMKRWGHSVESAGTIQGGLALGKAGGFEVLVSDLGLPDGQGTTLMEELLRLDGRLRGVAISGFGMEEDVRRSREAGFAEHLTKPVAAQRLKAVLEQIAAELRQPVS